MTDARPNEELTEATATGLRWITLTRLVMEVVVFASMVVLARLIPPAAFGVFALAFIVQELAINVPGEGVGSALVQRRSIERAHLQAGMALSLLFGAALALGALALAFVLVRPLFGDEAAGLVAVTTPWFLLGAVLALPIAVLRRRLDFRRLALLDLTGAAVRVVVSVVLAAGFGLDAYALALGGLAGIAVMVPVALLFAPVPLPRWNARAVRDLLPYGVPAALACFSWTGFRNGDYAIIGAKLGAAQAGFYWRGFQLGVEYQRKISTVVAQVAFPVLARTVDAEAMFELRRRMVRLLTVALFPLLTGLVLLAPVLIPWVFGPAWEPAVLPTQILAGAGAATVVIDTVGSVLMAAGRARALLGYGVAHFVVYVGVVLVVAGRGLTAVCIAAVSVHLVFMVVAYAVLLQGRAERTLPFLWGDVAAAGVSCVAFVGAALPVSAALAHSGVHPAVDILLVGSVGMTAYLAALRIGFPDAWRDLAALVEAHPPAAAAPRGTAPARTTARGAALMTAYGTATRGARQLTRVLRRDGAQVLAGRMLQAGADRLLAGARPFEVAVRRADLEAPVAAARVPSPASNSEQLVINWVANPPDESGGLMTMSRLIHQLEQRGHLCRLYIRYGGERRDLERDRLRARERFPHMRAEVHDVDDGMLPADAVFATSWPTAYAVRAANPGAVPFYLVQDFEPSFYPAGSRAALAEETYRFGFHGITAGRWLASKLPRDYGMTCDAFDLGVDLDCYRLENHGPRSGVVFYARPTTERRGYELGMLALDRFAELHPEIEIHLVGQEIRWRRPSFAFTSHGYLPAPELAALYNRCAAGLVLSLTNISLLPAELLATGCVPVMNDAENTRSSFDNPYTTFAPAHPDLLARALGDAVTRSGAPGFRADAAASVGPLSWELVGEAVEAGIRRGLMLSVQELAA